MIKLMIEKDRATIAEFYKKRVRREACKKAKQSGS